MFVYQKALYEDFTPFFSYKITFVNSQHNNTNSKDNFKDF